MRLNLKNFKILITVLIATLYMIGENPIAASADSIIISQPSNVYGEVGERVSFNIEVSEGYSLQWQYSKDCGKTWNNSNTRGTNSSHVVITVGKWSYGYLYRCEIKKDNLVVAYSDTVRICKDTEMTVISQPQNVVAASSETAIFTFDVSGTNINYQWQLSKDGATWENSKARGATTGKLVINVQSYIYKYVYRCIASDDNGKKVVSNEVRVEKPIVKSLEITEQPINCQADSQNIAYFYCKADGEDVKYTWQYSATNGEKWSSKLPSDVIGDVYGKLTVPVNSYRKSKCLYRCLVYDKYGNSLYSEAVKIVDAPITETFEIDVISDLGYPCEKNDSGICLLDSLFFQSQKSNSSTGDTYKTVINTQTSVNKSDVLLLYFVAYSKDDCAQLTVNVGTNYEGNYAVGKQPVAFYLPISNLTDIESISFRSNSKIVIGNAELFNYGECDTSQLKTGPYLLTDFEDVFFAEGDAIGPTSNALLANDDYLFSIKDGVLSVLSFDGKELSSLSGLGNTREFCFINNGSAIAVSSRENGMYLVDIQNPLEPRIVSRFIGRDMCTGIVGSDNIVFLADRYYGVHIIDVSDVCNPKLVSTVSNNKEYYDCTASDDYLYVSAWGEKSVDIYDVQDISNPVFCSSIQLGGSGGGLCVKESALFVSTGYSCSYKDKVLTDPGYGMGNHLEIYDVSDKTNPVWLSTSYIDGRYKMGGYDHWKVKVYGNYAFYSSTYPGIYVYDISDLKNPVRVAHIATTIPNFSQNYKTINNSGYIFPYDYKNSQQGAIGDIVSRNGQLYIADTSSGIYLYENSLIVAETNSTNCYSYSPVSGSSTYELSDAFSAVVLQGRTVYSAAVEEESGNVYVACGTEGVSILNSSYCEIGCIPTKGPAQDIRIVGNHIFVAESEKGVAVYSLLEDLTEVSRWSAGNATFTASDIEVSEDGSTIIVQAGRSYIYVLSFDDINLSVKQKIATSSLYGRNLSTGFIDNSFWAYGDMSYFNWASIENDDSYLTTKVSNRFSQAVNGSTIYGNYLISIANKGYTYVDISGISAETFANSSVVAVPGMKELMGKVASNLEEGLLVVSCGKMKSICIVDISNIDNPVLLYDIKVKGFPDIATISKNQIFVPLWDEGLLVINRKG